MEGLGTGDHVGISDIGDTGDHISTLGPEVRYESIDRDPEAGFGTYREAREPGIPGQPVNSGHIEHCHDASSKAQAQAPSSAAATGGSVHEGNIKLLPWLMLTAILSGFALAAGIFVLIQFAQMENNQARMAVHLMSNDALLLREGIIQPGDQWAGPEGNLEYGRKDQPTPRK